ncbi:MAG: hypothetical protein ABGX05_05950, partial [Pirellulaceae bacterium]
PSHSRALAWQASSSSPWQLMSASANNLRLARSLPLPGHPPDVLDACYPGDALRRFDHNVPAEENQWPHSNTR